MSNKVIFYLMFLIQLLLMATLLITILALYRTTQGDLNIDGKVDIVDLSIMADNFKEEK